MKILHKCWDMLVHVFWSLFFYGQLMKALDGLFMLFNARLNIVFSTWSDLASYSLLTAILLLSVMLSRLVVTKWRSLEKNPQTCVDKS